MTNTILVSIIAGTIALVSFISLLVLLQYLKINHLNPTGKGASSQVRKIVSGKFSSKQYTVLHDLAFLHKGTSTPVETLLVGPFGLLLVTTLGARGEYYGKVEDKDWIFVADNKDKSRTVLPNPLRVQKEAILALREEFARCKVYNVDISTAVVIFNTSRKTAVYVTQQGLLFSKKEFKHLLGRSKFEQDKGLAVDAVADVITSYSNHSISANTP